jgi:hypothetical protein
VADISGAPAQSMYQGRTRVAADLFNLYTSFTRTRDIAIGMMAVYEGCAYYVLCQQNADSRRGAVVALTVKVALLEQLLGQTPRLSAEDRGFYVNEAGVLAQTAAELHREAKDPDAHEVADLLTRVQVQLVALPVGR